MPFEANLNTYWEKTRLKQTFPDEDLKGRLIDKRKIIKEKLDLLKHEEIVQAKSTKHYKVIENKLYNRNANHSTTPGRTLDFKNENNVSFLETKQTYIWELIQHRGMREKSYH